MDDFSLTGAWTKGAAFISARLLQHALILIGIGVIGPMLLQFAVTGAVTGGVSPAMGGPMAGFTALEGLGGLTAALLALGLLLATYSLQIGSYFASWRLGLGPRPELPRAAGWGMAGGLVLTLLAGLVIALVVWFGSGAPPTLLMLLMVMLGLLVLAILYPVVAAFACVTLMLLVLVGMVLVGTQIGDLALMAMGGAGSNGVVMFGLSALALWVAARSCCTGPIMAARGSLNVFAALGRSWHDTAFEQFRILLYLALVGLVLAVAALLLGLLFGYAFSSNPMAFTILGDAGYLLFALGIGVPLAFLSALIPVGIHRELTPDTSAEVFA